MSLADFTPGMQRLLSGDFGESWVHVCAAGSGIGHGGPGNDPDETTDIRKADVRLTMDGEFRGWRDASVRVQVKTAADLRDHSDDEWAYDLDVATYNLLRQGNFQTRRILAVIGLSDASETVTVTPRGTLLVGQSAWVSLEGLPVSTNTETQVVYLPKDNVLDEQGLKRMLAEYGVPRSSPVQEVDEWDVVA